MRKALDWILLAVVLFAAVYQWQAHKDELRLAAGILRARFMPCSSPITYSVGGIDLGYTITPGELAAAAREAEAVWEGPARRNLFELAASSGEITINLVYDRRQSALDKIKAMGLATDMSLTSYKAMQANYDQLAAQLKPQEAALAARIAAYKAREAEFNSRVRYWNKRGSVPPAEYRRLDSTKAGLAGEFAGIKADEAVVNSGVDSLNALATALNQLIVELNINVQQYNREGSQLGSFEEGLYRLADGVRTIDLYRYSDHTQLVRLLAHEMGHALGMEHVADPRALMFPVNRGDDLGISPADLAELNRACTEGPEKEKAPPAAKPAGSPAASN